MVPWKISLDSEEDHNKLRNILFILISNLRKIAIMLLPFFDSKMRELLSRVGVPYDDTLTLIENLELDPTLFTVGEK
jgi:methionyl-tRNA synthetase